MTILANGKSIELKGHKSKVHSVAWNCIGSKLASGSTDHNARIWFLDEMNRATNLICKGEPQNELKGHSDAVDQIKWSPSNPDILATASADKSICLWDTRMNVCSNKISTQGENINICWHPNAFSIAVGSKDDLITFIDMNMMKITSKKQFPHEINEITWNKKGNLFFLTTGLGTIQILDGTTFKEVETLQAHTANCYCIEFEPNGRYFATGSADALVSIWDAMEYICVRTLSRLEWPVRTLSFSYDGAWIASASEDHFIDISSSSTGELVHKLSVPAAVNTVAWHPSQPLLAFAGDDSDKSSATGHGSVEGSVRVFGPSEAR